jgi:TetR/AcrR family transcriptional repressor of mexJK operon
MALAAKATKSRGGRPARHEVPLRNERLLAIATEAFARQGYDATTIDGIAATAGVAKRTIYSRYPNKKALFFAVVQRLTERRSFDEAGIDGTAPVEEGLRRRALSMIKAAFEPESISLQRMILNELKNFPDLGPTLWRTIEKEYGGPLAQYFRLQRAKGGIRSIKPGVFADIFMRSIFSFVNNVIILGYEVPSDAEIEDYLDDLIDVLVKGIRK